MRATAIESGVLPVVEALNGVPGVQTLWSCHGHPTRPANPYVTFLAPVEFAFLLHRALERQDGLRYTWHLRGSFLRDGAMQYTVVPNDVRLPEGRRRWVAIGWRSRMNCELSALANLVRRVSIVDAFAQNRAPGTELSS